MEKNCQRVEINNEEVMTFLSGFKRNITVKYCRCHRQSYKLSTYLHLMSNETTLCMTISTGFGCFFYYIYISRQTFFTILLMTLTFEMKRTNDHRLSIIILNWVDNVIICCSCWSICNNNSYCTYGQLNNHLELNTFKHIGFALTIKTKLHEWLAS